MKSKDKLTELSDLLYDQFKKFSEENKIIIHKIVIEDKQVKFEIWSVDDNIHISNFIYQKS